MGLRTDVPAEHVIRPTRVDIERIGRFTYQLKLWPGSYRLPDVDGVPVPPFDPANWIAFDYGRVLGLRRARRMAQKLLDEDERTLHPDVVETLTSVMTAEAAGSDDDDGRLDHECAVYWCPTIDGFESACHGGFDVCCAHPELHRTDRALDSWEPLDGVRPSA